MSKLFATAAAALLLSAGAASAAPLATDGLPAASSRAAYFDGMVVPSAPHRTGLSYGVGYNGRGTATGGPAGGLPSRN